MGFRRRRPDARSIVKASATRARQRRCDHGMIGWSAANRDNSDRSGRRNSAPPSPTRPPRAPMIAACKRPAHATRRSHDAGSAERRTRRVKAEFSGRFDRSDLNAGAKAPSSRAQDDGGNLGILGLLSVASLELFRGASKGPCSKHTSAPPNSKIRRPSAAYLHAIFLANLRVSSNDPAQYSLRILSPSFSMTIR